MVPSEAERIPESSQNDHGGQGFIQEQGPGRQRRNNGAGGRQRDGDIRPEMIGINVHERKPEAGHAKEQMQQAGQAVPATSPVPEGGEVQCHLRCQDQIKEAQKRLSDR